MSGISRGCSVVPSSSSSSVLSMSSVTLVTAGPSNVGKTALITRFCNDTFNENVYVPTTLFRYQHSDLVGSRIVRFVIWDTSGSVETNSSRSLVYREADVFLLCYNIADPGTLFTAINNWVPELRTQAPATPIILVGCQSDRRQASTLATVSPSQALAMSQQIGAVMYVETSSKMSRRGVSSVMEVAALTTLPTSLMETKVQPSPPSPPISKKQRQRSVSVSREVNWDGSLRSNGSNSSTLSSTRSDTSMESVDSSGKSSETRTVTAESPKIIINTNTKTPKTDRKLSRVKEEEDMVSIKCQRLRPDKTYEEVEIQVPKAVYNTMQNGNNDSQDNSAQQQSDRKFLALGSKIKCLFSKTDH